MVLATVNNDAYLRVAPKQIERRRERERERQRRPHSNVHEATPLTVGFRPGGSILWLALYHPHQFYCFFYHPLYYLDVSQTRGHKLGSTPPPPPPPSPDTRLTFLSRVESSPPFGCRLSSKFLCTRAEHFPYVGKVCTT